MSKASAKPHRLDTGDELDALVAEHEVVLVDFYTKGCTLCQSIEPIVGNVARATTATVAMLNPQTDLDLVDEYDIKSVPTLLLFEDGEVVGRMASGFEGTESIVEFVTESSSAERQ
ncbi:MULTISPECIES: thioredoxin family protein [Halolamina]|uniref:Thioredoxin n=1 Tax=Halolamina pelagica TaxID=699431 RepID=A0A1I5N3H5_9EURY|nr:MULTISPECIES: thioredoxin family protein [Halolamina]NHX36288.1 thioredoxin family protein [Halolamina sp. R1-12]SFP16349.1 Thioredoxin [Halolamina pelagica]